MIRIATICRMLKIARLVLSGVSSRQLVQSTKNDINDYFVEILDTLLKRVKKEQAKWEKAYAEAKRKGKTVERELEDGDIKRGMRAIVRSGEAFETTVSIKKRLFLERQVGEANNKKERAFFRKKADTYSPVTSVLNGKTVSVMNRYKKNGNIAIYDAQGQKTYVVPIDILFVEVKKGESEQAREIREKLDRVNYMIDMIKRNMNRKWYDQLDRLVHKVFGKSLKPNENVAYISDIASDLAADNILKKFDIYRRYGNDPIYMHLMKSAKNVLLDVFAKSRKNPIYDALTTDALRGKDIKEDTSHSSAFDVSEKELLEDFAYFAQNKIKRMTTYPKGMSGEKGTIAEKERMCWMNPKFFATVVMNATLSVDDIFRRMRKGFGRCVPNIRFVYNLKIVVRHLLNEYMKSELGFSPQSQAMLEKLEKRMKIRKKRWN